MPEKRFVFFKGKKYAVTDETARYYICAKTAFRKSNPDITVKTEPPEVTEKQERKKAEKKQEKEEVVEIRDAVKEGEK